MSYSKQFLTGSNAGTLYRLSPNPDADTDSGYSSGAVLEYSDDGGKTWAGYIHIAPECLDDLAKMFEEAAE